MVYPMRFCGTNFYVPMALPAHQEKQMQQLLRSPEVTSRMDFGQVMVITTRAGSTQTNEAMQTLMGDAAKNLSGVTLDQVYRYEPETGMTAGKCVPIVDQL